MSEPRKKTVGSVQTNDVLGYDPQLPHFILLHDAFELCLVHSLLLLELDPGHPILSALPLVRNDEPAAMRGVFTRIAGSFKVCQHTQKWLLRSAGRPSASS